MARAHTRLVNLTDGDLEFHIGLPGSQRFKIRAGQTVDYPHDYASDELLALLAAQKIKIVDHPPPGEKPRAPGL
jgi:hypothetical protein